MNERTQMMCNKCNAQKYTTLKMAEKSHIHAHTHINVHWTCLGLEHEWLTDTRYVCSTRTNEQTNERTNIILLHKKCIKCKFETTTPKTKKNGPKTLAMVMFITPRTYKIFTIEQNFVKWAAIAMDKNQQQQ